MPGTDALLDSSDSVAMYCLHVHEYGGSFINECSEPSGDVASGTATIDVSHCDYLDAVEG